MAILDDLKRELLRTHETFRGLHEEHLECETRLAQMAQNSLPSPEDEVEEKRLKIHKLELKDRMEEILREHRTALSA
jgi:uncharacterized protein YdcH (DUF465 family)